MAPGKSTPQELLTRRVRELIESRTSYRRLSAEHQGSTAGVGFVLLPSASDGSVQVFYYDSSPGDRGFANRRRTFLAAVGALLMERFGTRRVEPLSLRTLHGFMIKQ